MSLLVILMAGLFLAILNQTLLNVAMPHLMTEFNVSATTIQWLTTGYMLVNGVLIPLSAFLILRFGGRSLFLTAMALFTIGTFVCGIAPNFSTMLIGRLIQAAGGGILQPLVMTTILFIFPPESRGKGMGIFGLAMMFAPAVGPTLSGWIIENYSWRIMFYGLVPIGVIVIIFGFLLFKNMTEPKKVKLDVAGAILSIVGFASLLYGVSEAGSDGWDDPIVLTTVIVGAIGIIAFIVQQLKSKDPMLDFRVFKYDMFSLSSVINAIITVAMFAGMFLLPIYLQNLVGFTALQSGLLLLPGAIVMLIMSPISGILFDKVGPRPLAIVGLLITAVTTYEFTTLTLDTPYMHIVVIYAIRAFGMSLLMMPIMTAGMNQLPKQLNSHGTAMANTLRQISGSIGTSLITTIYTNRTTFHYAAMADQTNTADPTFMHTLQSTIQSVAQSMHISAEQAQQYVMKYLAGQSQLNSNVMGINDAFMWAAGLCIVGLVLSLFLRDVRKDKERKKYKEKELTLLPAPKEAKES
ncbi:MULTISPECIES: DHA2 family efflux MFS transporter permease subunit [Bacillus]|uniref:DHA2 family efflux MFS transporter permease subunit n=1 Tax=Bacillus glycinifermentans TaxID=1664069 RepID=A0AAJ3Z2I7_9BACI|nr:MULTISPECIES: DHA2 family efflux MFS transporter permease subunit [Bacillus]MBU8788487.1 DHA2 family efflux MFS transporter permease subunit [Bacillus glycinifermentans]MDU0071804.1 DHA2 family efflux MFS transporter permease subunit [Bacillus sp. IG6]MED8019965.1 DHA2 family efflux MFS transporter permease subunit [Bacillus glycinifermentans]NUJ17961.1 DHA2 family efflux MFS transporter permease subunit [Bacillus glycinifermentans]QAT67780.1 DHA2 family efflux MFS transporter permease subu